MRRIAVMQPTCLPWIGRFATMLVVERGVFDELDIRGAYFDYAHPAHPQRHGEFISHLSVTDLLFNMGPGAGTVMRDDVANAGKNADAA